MKYDIPKWIEVFKEALEGEIKAVKTKLMESGAGYPINIRKCQHIEENGNGNLYRMSVEDLELNIISDTQAFYVSENEKSNGYIVQTDSGKNELLVQLETYIGDNINEGKIEFDLTYLLKCLILKLENIKDSPFSLESKPGKEIAMKLFNKFWEINKSKIKEDYGLNPSQKNAVEISLGSPVCFIWGPPGTGKTRTISALLNEMANKPSEQRKKIIVTTHTNVALDTLMNKIVETKIKHNGDYNVLRYGYSTPELNSTVPTLESKVEEKIRKNHSNICRKIEKLYSDIIPNSDSVPVVSVWVKLNRAQRIAKDLELKEEEDQCDELMGKFKSIYKDILKQIFNETDVLGSTLTKFYSDENLNLYFDEAIIDEVSIAYPPQIFYIASRVKNKIILAGDFKQLPPIVISKDNRVKMYLEKNIFELLGLDQEYENFDVRPILNTQYRMHTDISTVVDQLFYAGRIRTSTEILEKVESDIELYSNRTKKTNYHPLVVLDTSECMNCFSEKDGQSRYNNFHKRIVLKLINDCGRKMSVGVITPYRGQKKKIREELYKLKNTNPNISVSTIHSFQGQEKDIIIMDLVDAPNIPPYFLNEYNNRGSS